jgi:hypothetical protein
MFPLAVSRETRVYTNNADFAVVGEIACLRQLPDLTRKTGRYRQFH